MAKTKIEWALYANSEKIYFEILEKDTYEQKYKESMTCINGCNAKIKFTAKKNGKKFFSTWNKEGHLHNEDCPYYVEYQGKQGRAKLTEYYKSQEVDDAHIQNTLRNKMNNLREQREGREKETIKDKKATIKIENSGDNVVPSYKEGEFDGGIKGRVYIGSIEASLITPAYIDTRKCVYGKMNNVQIKQNENKEYYGYINLKNDQHNISAYFPPAFYYAENNNLEEFKKIIEILKENENKDIMFMGIGFIKNKKDNKGLNIEIVNKLHFVINETSYDEIISKKNIKSISFDKTK